MTQKQLSAADLGCVDAGNPLNDQVLGSNPAFPEGLSEVLSQHSDDGLQTLIAKMGFKLYILV